MKHQRTNPYLAVLSAIFIIFCVVFSISGLNAKPEVKSGETAPEGGTPFETKLIYAEKAELFNRSDYDVDINDYLFDDLPFSVKGRILIIHTHGTEAYSMADGLGYEPSDIDRTLDSAHNMLAVGESIAKAAEKYGAAVIRSETINDYPSYNTAYDNSLKDAEYFTGLYPDIGVIIDVHRDAGATNDNKYRTAANINGESMAKLEIVVGTDGGGLSHDEWRKNLMFAVKLYRALEGSYPGIMRPICLRNARFNQHLMPGCLLIEVGGNGDTLSEAKRSAAVLGEVLARILKE